MTASSSRPAVDRILLGIVLVTLALRLALLPWFAGTEPAIHDAKDYDRLAVSLARGEGFTLPSGEPTARRPPLYPAFVAQLYGIAGVGNHQAVRAVQAVLALLVPIGIYLVARELYGDRDTARWAAALSAVYPGLWGHTYLLLTETIFTIWLVAAAWATVRAVSSGSRSAALGAGLLTGAGALTRSVLQLTPPVQAGLLWLSSRRFDRRPASGSALLVLLGFILVAGPWIVRNSLVLGELTPVDTQAAHALRQGTVEFEVSSGGRPILSSEGGARETGDRRDRPIPGAIRYVVAHPLETAAHSLAKAVQFWQLERELVGAARRGYVGPLSPGAILVLALIINGVYVVIVLAALAGAVLDPPADRLRLVALLLFPTVIWVAHATTIAHSRYHVPLVPLLAVFAGRAFAAPRVLRRAAEDRRRLALVGASGVLLVASWVVQLLLFDLPDLLGGPVG